MSKASEFFEFDIKCRVMENKLTELVITTVFPNRHIEDLWLDYYDESIEIDSPNKEDFTKEEWAVARELGFKMLWLKGR